MESHVDFEKLVRLARLSLSADEEASLCEDLKQMAAFASAVTSVIPIQDETESGICPLREDRPSACLSAEEVLALSPAGQGGFISVPSVMEESDHD